MERAQAARLLGVPEDAEPALIRRAYRAWVRLAHPDAGGDPEHFARLTHARRTLLRPGVFEPRPMPAPPPRAPLSVMAHPPRRPALHLLGAAVSIAAVALPLAGVGSVLAAVIAGCAAAAWAWLTARACLRPGADAGHRITLLTLIWLPVAVAQVACSAVLGTAIIETLPVLVLPFVAVIASVNAGAGLWRPLH